MHLSILGFSVFCLRESSWEVWNLTGVEMGTHLWETLRSLCLKTQWKYAVFWRLEHRDRKILTWEDTYYNNKESPNHSENMCCVDTVVDLPQGGYRQDLLGLAMAEMSCTIHPLGEGVIGKVAASGTHKWNFADKSASSCLSSSEYCDGWEAQFSAGIRTVAVVAVTPVGVVQLGSLDTVSEDLDLVSHIKDIFCSLQSSPMGFRPKSIQYTMKTTPCLAEIPAKSSDEEIFHDYRGISDEVVINIKPDNGHDSLPVFGKLNNIPHVLPLSDLRPKEAVEMVDKHVRNAPLTLQVGESAQFVPQGIINLQMKLHNKKCGETNGWKNIYMSSRHIYPPAAHISCTENTNLYNDILESVVNVPIQPVDSLVSMAWEEVNSDRMICPQNEGHHAPETFEMQLGGKKLEQQFKLQTKIKHVDVDALLRLSDGCEVHEALSAANDMQEQHHFSIEAERGEIAVSIEPPGGRCSGQFMAEFGSENLLEAVAANEVSLNRVKNESSVCESLQSIVTTEKSLQVPIHAKHTYISAVGLDGESSTVEDADYQLTQTQHLGEAHIRTQKKLSSKILRTRPRVERSDQLRTCHRQQSGREVEPAKVSKKRARYGETCGTRPRDRQLIEDRIKELRELVPHGKKCSIELLLGHTIKHMLFLQSITEYAKKLRKFDESMVHEQGGSHLHGSSWALELGSQTLRPMVVENLNMNGQMLVEMMCDECSLFFDIGDTLIGLGLTILKGATEIRGEKMWACFIVEGDKGIHRMDILWSLMLLLQSRSTI